MTKFDNPLNNLKVASPCSANWDEMIGNERQRHCGDCQLNVYNISGMTRTEAENFLVNAEGRVCVRFFKRADGTVLTKDCPVGWKAIKRRVSKIATAFASLVFAVLSGIGVSNYFAKSGGQQTMGTMMPITKNMTMGEVAIDETNSNVAVQGKPIATMGNFTVPQNTDGQVSNLDEVKRQIIKKHGR
jgi:hypothetical protein